MQTYKAQIQSGAILTQPGVSLPNGMVTIIYNDILADTALNEYQLETMRCFEEFRLCDEPFPEGFEKIAGGGFTFDSGIEL